MGWKKSLILVIGGNGKRKVPFLWDALSQKKSLGTTMLKMIEATLRQSLQHAHNHPDGCLGYMAQHAQDMNPDIMQAHVKLYVNDYTCSYGADGQAAIEQLLQQAKTHKLI